MRRRKFIFSTAATLAATPLYARANRPHIRIGQIGLAHPHSLGKLNAIRSLPDAYDLVGVVEPDLSLRKRAKL